MLERANVNGGGHAVDIPLQPCAGVPRRRTMAPLAPRFRNVFSLSTMAAPTAICGLEGGA
jgi:hypothetical protein